MDSAKARFWFTGGGIASLTGAAVLILDGRVSGKDIHIFEETGVLGGGLDASQSSKSVFLSRGGRMFEKHYSCMFQVLSRIPSVDHRHVSIAEDIFDFNRQIVSDAECRILIDGTKKDVSSYELSMLHQWQILKMLVFRKNQTRIRIDEWFSPSFFKTNFWYLWTTSFSFQPWHNVDELRRYFLRFIHLFPGFNKYTGILRTRYNQYDSIVLPMKNWLLEQGVSFDFNTSVQDVSISQSGSKFLIDSLTLKRKNSFINQKISENDHVFITLGSMVEDSVTGSEKHHPKPKSAGFSWSLWKKVAAYNPEFGNPAVFSERIRESHWISFTVTLRSPSFFKYIEELSTNKAGTSGLISLPESGWFLSVVLFHQPFFRLQPDGTFVFWGYGLFPENTGNFIKKKMTECSGEEILAEVFSHLRVPEFPEIMKDAVCIPVYMPYITSQFLTRNKGDRPLVSPESAGNFSFLGQFTEISEDVVFTVEYSVRSALEAVKNSVLPDLKVPEVYKGYLNPLTVIKALFAVWR